MMMIVMMIVMIMMMIIMIIMINISIIIINLDEGSSSMTSSRGRISFPRLPLSLSSLSF